MNEEWSPIVVSIIGGLFLIPPALAGLVGVLLSRSEPRRAKELLALNAMLDDIPVTDPGYAALQSYRSRLAVSYSERAVSVDPSLISIGFLSGGWVVLTIAAVLREFVGDVPDANLRELLQVGIELVGWVGVIASLLGVFLLIVYLVALGIRGGRLLRQGWKMRRDQPDEDEAAASDRGRTVPVLPQGTKKPSLKEVSAMSVAPPFTGPAPGALTRTLLEKLDATPSVQQGRWSVSQDARRALGWVISVLEQNRRLRPRPPAELEHYARTLAPTLGRMRGARDHRALLASLRVVEARLERERVDSPEP